MNPDLNIYDTTHVTTHHPLMTDEEWKKTYQLAWKTYYTPEHIDTIARRAWADGVGMSKVYGYAKFFYGSVMMEDLHPLESGWIRRKYRKDRRPGYPIEPPISFHLRLLSKEFHKAVTMFRWWWQYYSLRRSLKSDPDARRYTDEAIAPSRYNDTDIFKSYELAADVEGVLDEK